MPELEPNSVLEAVIAILIVLIIFSFVGQPIVDSACVNPEEHHLRAGFCPIAYGLVDPTVEIILILLGAVLAVVRFKS